MSEGRCKPSCQQVINSFPGPYVIIDRDYNIMVANQAYRNHYGAEQGNLTGRKCYAVSHHKDEPCSRCGERCPLEEVMLTGEISQVVHVHYGHKEEGEERVQITATPLFDDNGSLQFIGEYISPLPSEKENKLLVGRSQAMLRTISLLQRVAPTRSTVILLGESGVGKECAAQYLHQFSNCSEGPFIVIDCGTLGENLIESELFGHEKGSFTGASAKKVGLFEAANGGTLFIDEVGELPLELQTKLLRVLETGTIRRVGGTGYLKVDVRVVAATNRDPQAMVRAGRLREDLYYRLSAFPIRIPSLRERKDDIPALAEHFLLNMEQGDMHLPLSVDVIGELLSHDYPGNVRELRNILERAVILAAGDALTPEHMVFDDNPVRGPSGDDTFIGRGEFKPLVSAPIPESDLSRLISKRGARPDYDVVLRTLSRCNGHRGQAASQLGISERTLYRYLKELRVEL